MRILKSKLKLEIANWKFLKKKRQISSKWAPKLLPTEIFQHFSILFETYSFRKCKKGAFTCDNLYACLILQPSLAFHVETKINDWFAKQMTGFYMKCKIGLK